MDIDELQGELECCEERIDDLEWLCKELFREVCARCEMTYYGCGECRIKELLNRYGVDAEEER